MNFKFLQLIALSGIVNFSAVWGLTCVHPITNALIVIPVPESVKVSVPAVQADSSRRDWSKQEPFPISIPTIPESRRMEFVFPDNLDPQREDFVILFYHGDEITQETLRGNRWASLGALAQWQWDEETRVGGIALAGGFSHLQLAQMVPSDRQIIGGVRYHEREQKNSTVFYSLEGTRIDAMFFSVQL